MKVLVTGGAGFIGSTVTKHLLSLGLAVVCVDKLTYAASPQALRPLADHPHYNFVRADICDEPTMRFVLDTHQPDALLHLAAESHVDRSIDGPADFVQTNIVGTSVLLQAARQYWESLGDARRSQFRFLHVSTDEVFGSLSPAEAPFDESSPYAPRSPYAASKAASDHLVRAWGETYGLPVLISNCSNNYGPWQFPEKLIPLMIAKAFDQEPMPVFGQGDQVRDWLHVEDHARALAAILERGCIGETYAVGGTSERQNIEVVRGICAHLDRRRWANAPHTRLIAHVEDRPGHDRRYAITAEKLKQTLGWAPLWAFEDGLAATIDWYLANEEWWRTLLHRKAAGARRGLSLRRIAE